MKWGFERVANIIKAYIPLLNCIPNLENIKLEKIKVSDNYIAMVISNTIEIFNLKVISDDPASYPKEYRKSVFGIEIYKHKDEIIKEVKE